MTSPRRARILVIDDDHALAKAIALRLEQLGHECVVAHTGARGFIDFDAHAPDLVVTDLNMPLGDGVAVAKRMRRVSDVPIIVVTAVRSDYEPFLALIPNLDVLEKPFDPGELEQLVKSRLSATLQTSVAVTQWSTSCHPSES